MTFEQAFERYAAEKVKEFSTDRYRKQWRRAVEQYALPVIGQRPIDAIDLHDVLKVLEPIWADKTETASKLRQKIEGALSWATVKGYRSGDNPARWGGNLQMVLAAPRKVSPTTHEPALKIDDAPRWWLALQERKGMGADALRFQAMTATRTSAVRLATWDEFDLSKRLWTIPPGRASAKISRTSKAKTVPLTDAMIALLESLPRLDGCKYVFWAARGGALSDAAAGKVMRAMHEADLKAGGKGFVDKDTGERAVPHGIRTTFRSWVGERTNFDTNLAEVALFHTVGSKTEQTYARSDLVEKRRSLMAAWNAFLTGAPIDNVVQLVGVK
ncbi:MAG: tyrosine-type recombinase/integrase [Erythrobacter sp.]